MVNLVVQWSVELSLSDKSKHQHEVALLTNLPSKTTVIQY